MATHPPEDRTQEGRKHIFVINGAGVSQPDAHNVIGQQAGWESLEQAQKQAERFGAHRYLGKPLDLDDLLAAIREMIGKA